MEGGFAQSPLRLNESLRTRERWDEDAIRARATQLAAGRPLLPAAARPILHGYDEDLAGMVRVYAIEEVIAEKLRALLHSALGPSPHRDVYDLWRILTTPPVSIDRSALQRILPDKCAIRGVTYTTSDDFFPEPLITLVRQKWEDDMGALTADLPPIDDVLPALKANVAILLGEM